MTELRQREWLVAFQPRWDRLEVMEEVVKAPRWWDVSAALYKLHPWSVIHGVWAVLDDWPMDEELEDEMSWQPIATAPRDGSLIKLKREFDGRPVFEGRGFYGIMAEDAPSRISMLPDHLSLEDRLLFIKGYNFPDSPRWLREGGRFCFPEPTHWRPLQEDDEEL